MRGAEQDTRAHFPDMLDRGQVAFHVVDGFEGLAEHGPYDAIHVGAAAPAVPAALLEQVRRQVVPGSPPPPAGSRPPAPVLDAGDSSARAGEFSYRWGRRTVTSTSWSWTRTTRVGRRSGAYYAVLARPEAHAPVTNLARGTAVLGSRVMGVRYVPLTSKARQEARARGR